MVAFDLNNKFAQSVFEHFVPLQEFLGDVHFVADDARHFFQLPVPDDFFSPAAKTLLMFGFLGALVKTFSLSASSSSSSSALSLWREASALARPWR